MKTFAFLSALAAGISLLMAGLVLGRGVRSRTGLVFASLCASVSWWAFAEHQTRQADTFSAAHWWLHANAFWPVTAAMMLHFALVFTRRESGSRPWPAGRWAVYVVSYGVSMLYAAVFLTTDVWGTPVKQWWGWTGKYPHSLVSDSSTLWVAALTIAAASLCWRYWATLRPGPRKQQAALVATGLSLPIAIGLTTDALLPALDIPFPELAGVAFAAGVAGFVGYGMWRYQLFSITPASAADRIVATMGEALFLTDLDTRVRVVNPATLDLLGYERESELVGRPMAELLLEDTQHGPAYAPEPNQLGTHEREAAFRRSGGELVPVALTVSSLTRGDDAEGYVWVARDITERQEADQLRADSVAMVAHELKAPLTVMLGNAALLERSVDGPAEPESVKRMALRVREQSQRMAQLVGRMLDLSQMQAGVFSLDVQPVDLEEAAKKWVSDVPVSDCHQLEFEPHEIGATVRCDPSRLSVVLANLVGNAVKYSPDGGVVRIVTRRDGDEAVIEVTDHGLGIAPEDLPHVFERYKRGDDTARLVPGSGLGLHLSHKIVEAHRGTIQVTSRPGEGSTFSVRIPLGGPDSD